jgi:hypothetical protein
MTFYLVGGAGLVLTTLGYVFGLDVAELGAAITVEFTRRGASSPRRARG